MNETVEKITAFIEKELSGYESCERIQIILDLREVMDGMERQAMIEEYELEPEYFE
jgi:hypothetical protein